MSRAKQRLIAALEFLAEYRQSLICAAGFKASEDKKTEFATGYWWPREPIYCWTRAYGDFQPATLKAGVERGWIDRKDDYHAYRITDAGLAALKSTAAKEGGAL